MKQKINVRLAFIALIAIIATTVSITFVYYRLFQTRVLSDLKLSAELLVETGLFRNDSSGAGADRLHADVSDRLGSGELRITRIDKDGIVLFDNDTSADALSNHLDRPEIKQALENGEGQSIRRSDSLGMNYFYYALKLKDGTILRVSTLARGMISVFVTVLPVVIGLAALILAVCILIGHALTVQLIRPINQMAEHLEDQNFPETYKELKPFADKIRSQHVHILSAAKARQDFTASVSHELKTPLTAVSGYAELIENRMLDAEGETHAAAQIRHNADRLLALINDIIRLSEMDHNEIPRHFEQVDLYREAQECCRTLQVNAKKKEVILECSGVSAGILADKELIRELLVNLIQNAITYNHVGGRVLVRVTIEDSHPVLIVKDTGIGIPADQQEHVFERFYRVDKGRSRETGGTGLGLAIVKHITEIHSAGIRLFSEPGIGTEIQITF